MNNGGFPTSAKSLRVLFVNRMAGLERGGGETFDLEISKRLKQMGVEVDFLTGAPQFSKPRLSIPHARTHHLHTPWLAWFPWDRVKGGWRLRQLEFEWFEWRAKNWILRHQNEFDVIQICELPNLVYWLKNEGLRIPVVMRLTAPNYYDPRGGVPLADALMASGTSIRKLHDKGVAVQDIPNAVDETLFCPHTSEFRRENGIPEDALVILYVARFQAFKNHALLLKAFAAVLKQHPNAHLVLAGDGPLKTASELAARDLSILDKTHFMGNVEYQHLPDIYAAADVMAISSDYESFCFAALEAMASAVPIVTTDCGWVPQLVKDGGGVVVSKSTPECFAGAILKLVPHPDERVQMGLRGRQLILERHRWESSADILLNLYHQVANRKAIPRVEGH